MGKHKYDYIGNMIIQEIWILKNVGAGLVPAQKHYFKPLTSKSF